MGVEKGYRSGCNRYADTPQTPPALIHSLLLLYHPRSDEKRVISTTHMHTGPSGVFIEERSALTGIILLVHAVVDCVGLLFEFSAISDRVFY